MMSEKIRLENKNVFRCFFLNKINLDINLSKNMFTRYVKMKSCQFLTQHGRSKKIPMLYYWSYKYLSLI